jgi:hypothetical protein
LLLQCKQQQNHNIAKHCFNQKSDAWHPIVSSSERKDENIIPSQKINHAEADNNNIRTDLWTLAAAQQQSKGCLQQSGSSCRGAD